MNCKPGDLAIVVKSDAGNEGKIVRCIRLVGARHWKNVNGSVDVENTWEVDQQLMGWGGEKSPLISDKQLRPINNPGDDAVDEVIQRLGTPHKETA